jgi:hypothetical protein
MTKTSLIIVLLEDDHHKMLVYRYLKFRGVDAHRMRIEISPSGEGSAESWVRKTFVKETGAYRARTARTALIVIIDADIFTVQDRLVQLDKALKDAGKRAVSQDEQIARVVPKRNVETWVLCLNGGDVNEESDDKRSRDNWKPLIPEAAKTLFHWTQEGTGRRVAASNLSGVGSEN